MGFNDFFKREDVYKIIKQTLETEYSLKVEFLNRLDKATKESKNKCIFYCIPRLNIIFSKYVNKRLLIGFLIRTLSGNQSIIKQLMIKLYIVFGVFVPRLFSSNFMLVCNEDFINTNIIYPGNKKIKILDFKNSTVTNIKKTGFKGNWFHKEIEFRVNSKYDFVLPILEHNDSRYKEALLTGIPMSRLQNKKRKPFLNKTNLILDNIKGKPENIEIKKYVESLHEIVSQKLSDRSFKQILNISDMINRYFLEMDYIINVVDSHGDFQKGNIFITEHGEVKILDWETFDRRSENYDTMIYNFNLRNSHLLVTNMQVFLNDRSTKIEFSNMSRIDILLLFVLEDICWLIEENIELPENSISIGLENYNKVTVYNYLQSIIN
ncbi:hypothetical protein [Mariniplasma anaerobium]|uniref:Aminoglycoside phosphotransferase domain-containing protein n=1 Tax=Mariniplasma anaerobium TaxID=2735436 RepID=A0A7U9TL18_9MOLU|nr:hypothetical protein [Mariniplasma anaerobium]BCR36095.1 hypothetical protein MPAN_009880 [Mariniplasma anaerobium]